MKNILKYIGYCLCLMLPVIIIISIAETYFFKNEYPFVYKTALILSGSMEPTLSVDDLVIVKRADEINRGDIIAFYDENGNKVMHRVIDVENNTITTQGDANNVADTPISKDKVCGKYVGKIKYLGKIIKFIKTPLGISVCFVLIIIILLIPERYEGKHAKHLKQDKILDKTKTIIAIVGYGVLLTFCIVTGYNSKYTKTFGGTSSAQVARFAINTNNSIETNNLRLTKLNKNASYTFTISNKNEKGINEVTTNYDVIVTFPLELKGVSLSLKNDETIINSSVSNNGKTFTFYNVGTFQAGIEQTDELILNFVLDDINVSTTTFNKIQIYIKATQID